MGRGWYRMVGDDVEPIDGREAGKVMDDPGRQLGRDEIGRVEISTVFLGLDHGFGDGPMMLFETMVFQRDTRSDIDGTRYSTKAEALAGHAAYVERAKAGEFDRRFCEACGQLKPGGAYPKTGIARASNEGTKP